MNALIVRGGNRLEGDAEAGAAKNAVLPIMAAAILAKGQVRLRKIPRLTDVESMMRILKTLGLEARWEGVDVVIDGSGASGYRMPEGLSKEIRSSIFMLGPILARRGQATFTYPGGCEIGLRPIDLHLSGLRALGAVIREEGGLIHCSGVLRGADIHLDYPSVGATENIMMAAATAKGETVVSNAAREPEVEDLAAFINAMGGKVSGAGGGTIVIEGVHGLHGVEYAPMTDRIVAGTLLCAAAVTRGDVLVRDGRARDMEGTLSKLREMGCGVEVSRDGVRLRCATRPFAVRSLETQPYPGFPTDMQAQMVATLATCGGIAAVTENVFENRFGYVGGLRRMGADIAVHGRLALVRGVSRLSGAQVVSRDLRGGAALVLAGLGASGETVVGNAQFVDRGYAGLEVTLRSLGADIERK